MGGEIAVGEERDPGAVRLHLTNGGAVVVSRRDCYWASAPPATFSFSFRSDKQVEQQLGYRDQIPGYLNYRPGACGVDNYQLLGNTNQRDYA